MKLLGPRLLVRKGKEYVGGYPNIENFSGYLSEGQIIEVGKNYDKQTGEEIPFLYKKGDFILFDRNQATPIQIDKEILYQVNLHSVYGKVLSGRNVFNPPSIDE